jgi:hypothetical protein
MEQDSQLLCTFTTVSELETTIETVKASYTLSFNKVYVLENTEDPNQLILTYNITKASLLASNNRVPTSTISVHRKKQTNTIYTINAINKLIENKNNGKLDKSFRIDWSELKNTILVTAYGKLKTINTKLSQIIEL